MNNSTAPIILPVESQVRELDAKLLLACAAAERGFPVYIGSRRFINFSMPRLPRGVFVAKSLRGISTRLLRIIRALGHDVVAWDEESLVRFPGPDYYPWRFASSTFAQVQQFFAWGEDDAELLRNYPGYNGAPIHVTGNPRCDLLRPELRDYFAAEADTLRRVHGEFILVNTNFSFVNNFVPSLNLMLPDLIGPGHHVSRTGWGMSPAFARGTARHQQQIFASFVELLPRLARWFPGHRVILRPHPSENHDVWRNATRGCHNLHVIHEGNVVPWLLASRLLLHNGCTTAVEAALLDVPAVTYQAVADAAHDYALPNGLSHCARDHGQVRHLVAEILGGTRRLVPEQVRTRILARHVASASGPLAVDRIVALLTEQGFLHRQTPRPPLRRWLPARLGATVRTAQKTLLGLVPGSRSGAAYHAHRFPALTSAELNVRIRRLSGLLGRFRHVHAAPFSEHVFVVSGTAPDQTPLAA